MKNIIPFLFLASIFFSTSSNAQWVAKHHPYLPTPIFITAESVDFANPSIGVAVGYVRSHATYSEVWATSDSGTTWNTLLTLDSTYFEKVICINDSTYIATGNSVDRNNTVRGVIAKTNDYGLTWSNMTTQYMIDKTVEVNDSTFVNFGFDSTTSVNSEVAHISKDFGATWREITGPVVSPNRNAPWSVDLVSLDANLYVFSTNRNYIVRIDTNLNSPDTVVINTNNNFRIVDVSYANSSLFALSTEYVGGSSEHKVWKSIDDGLSWSQVSNGTIFNGSFEIYEINFLTDLIGWAIGQFDVLKTTDGGVTWIGQDVVSSQPQITFYDYLSDIVIVDQNLAYLYGYEQFFMTTNGGASNSTVGIQEESGNYELNLFPNPSSGIFNLEGDFTANTSIKIFSITGELIYSKELSISNQQTIDMNGFPKGMYLYQLIDGKNEVNVGKLILR